VVLNDLSHHETQELLGEGRVKSGLLGKGAQPRHLLTFPLLVGWREADCRLVLADGLGDLEPFSEHVHHGGVDVVDTRPEALESIVTHQSSTVAIPGISGGDPTLPEAKTGCPSQPPIRRAADGYGSGVSALPVVYFDTPLPDAYRDLVDGRLEVVGPDSGLETAVAVIAGARVHWNGELLDTAPSVRVVSRTGIGYDNVDVAAATERGVIVCNAPEAPSVSTAEHTVALLMAVTKHLRTTTAMADRGEKAPSVGIALELDGRRLGLVGLGRIARRVAAAASALGMEVVAHDPFIDAEMVDGVRLVGLDEVFSDSDVVSLHAPGGEATRHLVDAGRLASMRRGAYLVNCARGSLVDQEALLAALDSGQLAGAALDVTEPEPLPAGHPLLGREDVLVTPHVASSTAAGRRRLYEHAIDNALAVLEGRPATTVTR
jgi:D-3-phosphoglycerate dehydrogenase